MPLKYKVFFNQQVIELLISSLKFSILSHVVPTLYLFVIFHSYITDEKSVTEALSNLCKVTNILSNMSRIQT